MTEKQFKTWAACADCGEVFYPKYVEDTECDACFMKRWQKKQAELTL